MFWTSFVCISEYWSCIMILVIRASMCPRYWNACVCFVLWSWLCFVCFHTYEASGFLTPHLSTWIMRVICSIEKQKKSSKSIAPFLTQTCKKISSMSRIKYASMKLCIVVCVFCIKARKGFQMPVLRTVGTQTVRDRKPFLILFLNLNTTKSGYLSS